jgi:phosphoribosylformimino-5-aminoimidazole carboxamide ribotide isomerase
MVSFPNLNLIASGGISSNGDIDALNDAGIPSAVFGKAFYEGLIDVNKLKINRHE